MIGLLCVFLQFKEFEFYCGAILKDMFTDFQDLSSDDFGHEETRSRSKKRVVLWRTLFSLQFQITHTDNSKRTKYGKLPVFEVNFTQHKFGLLVPKIKEA